MTGVLEGVKVVEVGLFVAVPGATAMMADWGAEVIKVEPLTGELQRGSIREQGVISGGFHVRTELMTRNKKGIAIDLKKEAGRDILYQLVQRADVFMSNYTVDVINKLKLDYATLSQLNPSLVYGIATAYGTAGPDKDVPGFDRIAAWARSGIQHVVSEPGSPPPMIRNGMLDAVVAGYAAAAILAALLHREKTGKGQQLELSLYQTGVWINQVDIQNALIGTPLPPCARSKTETPLAEPYRTKDGRWLMAQLGMSPMSAENNWPDICRTIERPELANDPRFNNMERQRQNSAELIGILDEVFASKTREEWEKRLRENGFGYGRIQTPLEVINDPQALANDFFAEIDHPAVGKVKLVNTPVKFHQNPASIRTSAPEVGQHTEEILLDLGYSWDNIGRLKEQRVIL